MPVSAPRPARRARMALLCAADSGPREPSRCTGREGRASMSGTMVGSVPQPAIAPASAQAQSSRLTRSLDQHVVLDRLHAVDVLRHDRRLADAVAGMDEAAQLHDAL